MTESDKDILIIKWDVDSFERTYNKKLSEYADIVSIPSVYDVNCPDKDEKKKRIRESLTRLNSDKPLSGYKKIIVFEDLNITWALRKFVSDSKKIHLWYWNLIDLSFKDSIKLRLIKSICNAWTFDERQAKDLGLKHNTQFYIENTLQDSSPECDYDLFFVGLNKGRKEILNRIAEVCSEHDLKAKIVIAGEKDSDGNIIPLMDYHDVTECIRKSRVLLEIGREDQEGLTVRSLEALYFNKALVTNNKYIHEKKFFTSGNSFVLDPDNMDGLVEFIRSAKARYAQEAYDYYSVNAWLGRF